MGVFSTSITESFDGGLVPELEINDYNAGALASDNFAEMAILGSVEVTAMHKALVESLAGQEIAAMEEGYEVVYEASSVSSVIEKIKSLLKKAIEKIKSLFEKAIAVFRSWVSSDKDFMKKYQATFTKNWLKLKKLDMKVFKYADCIKSFFTGNVSDGVTMGDAIIEKINNGEFDFGKNGGGKVKREDMLKWTSTKENIAKLEKVKAEEEKLDYTSEQEKGRAIYFNEITGASESALTAKEFSDSLYEFYRSDESAKDSMDKSELEKSGYSSTDIISRLTNGEKSTSNFDKQYKKIVKVLNKKINDITKQVSKEKYTSTDDDENKFKTLMTWLNVQYSATISLALECLQTEQGQFLQACKEYSRTCKSIATKVVAMGEKRLAQEESWDYSDDTSYADSFMNSVVIK